MIRKGRAMPKWRVRVNRIGAFVIAFVAMLFAVSTSWRAWGVPMYPGLDNVAHAGGGLGDLTYVNGVDAFEASYAKGFRSFEVDFQRTRDGVLVCSHDWEPFGGEIPDFERFLAVNARFTHPLCTFGDLVAWFRAHPDATLISDAKVDTVTVNVELRMALHDQLLPSVYDLESALALSQNGRYPLILAVYRMPDIYQRYLLVGSMRGKRIHLSAVSMSIADAMDGLGYWSKLWVDAPVYAYTVNSCEPDFALRLMGVDAVYTDFMGAEACE
ncbi:MAG: glycerophosphodiester phosphodiesterase family protein [Devosia sp.]